ncbi:unnamed protein product [Rotaria sp. Silwood1]|nr:unnamed protein product [Rotaria sp. Silwood1]CAF3854613.1 unnamed protein product [Rotaria sp. Silwood1]CAF3916395.1 unnamed protein product [Rotaria sp. Silwood1]CAF3985754.1 unnamed protein product [Rotaria sp. Silwood1]CAF4685737.1 unnamed protein product [Rotaria sp. Silwood1]
MNEKALIALLRLYLSKKFRFNYEILKTRLECGRLIRNYRRNSILKAQLTLLILDHSFFINLRSIWSFKKSGEWWMRIVPYMSDQQFKENFRIEQSTFASLLNHIGPYMKKLNTNYRTSIPVEKIV